MASKKRNERVNDKEFVDPFSEIEWNFDDVPESELIACCLWEYGRESTLLVHSSGHFREMIEAHRRGEKYPPFEMFEDYEEFLGAFWQTDQGCLVIYNFIKNHGGAASPPWQEIQAKLREKIAGMAGERSFRASLTCAMRGELEDLWLSNLKEWQKVRELPDYDRDDDSMAWEACTSLILPAGRGGEKHGETVAAFTINFRQFRDREIGQAFAGWLKANRPRDCREPTDQGHKKRDLRVRLDRLGIMRLLHRSTLREMPQKFPAAWKAFAGYEWYKERKRALKTFRELFPFFPKTEEPLSWPTKGGRSS